MGNWTALVTHEMIAAALAGYLLLTAGVTFLYVHFVQRDAPTKWETILVALLWPVLLVLIIMGMVMFGVFCVVFMDTWLDTLEE